MAVKGNRRYVFFSVDDVPAGERGMVDEYVMTCGNGKELICDDLREQGGIEPDLCDFFTAVVYEGGGLCRRGGATEGAAIRGVSAMVVQLPQAGPGDAGGSEKYCD